MKKILGLDAGTNSLGWAVVKQFDDGSYELQRKGVVVFQEGVKIEKGIESSKAAERTSHRSIRRQYFRRRLRKIEVLKVLIKYNLCPNLSIEALKNWKEHKIYPLEDEFMLWQRTIDGKDINPYSARHICLHNILNLSVKEDRYLLGRAFYHLAQRRGFLSNRLDQSEDNEEQGKVKNGILNLTQEMTNAGCEYLGDFFYKLYKEQGNTIKIRTRYTDREEHYLKEFNAICNTQSLPDDMISDLTKAIYYQRPLKSQKQSIGKCTFEKKEPRCSESHPLFEEFRKLCFVNNIKIQSPHDSELRYLTFDEKEKIDKLFYRRSKSDFDFEDIAKELAGKNNYCWKKDVSIDKPYKFNYRMTQGVCGCPTQAALRNVFGQEDWQNAIAETYILKVNHKGEQKSIDEMANDIWNILFSFDKKDKVVEFAKSKLQMDEDQAQKFAAIKLRRGYASLSIKAIKRILPFLQQGMLYSHAVFFAKIPEIVGLDIWNIQKEKIINDIYSYSNLKEDTEEKQSLEDIVKEYLSNNFELNPGALDKLYHPSMIDTYEDAKPNKDGILQLGSPMTNAIRNPMAMRSLHQIRKVINQLLLENEIDQSTEIHIEYARELNDANKRKAIADFQRNREKERKTYISEIKTLYKEAENKDIEPTDDDIEKYQYWVEQNHICLYTGKSIGITQFIGANPEFDIEHTIPRSVGGDSTKMNLTLCDSKFNRDIKKNQLPSQLANHTGILERISHWKLKIVDLEKQIDRLRTHGGIEKSQKDRIIQKRHLLKLELDYWKGKYDRFVMTEVPDGFARRQGVGIGLISKYAGLYLKSLFHDSVDRNKKQIYTIKGPTTAEFRKMWGLQDYYEKKSRDNHAHHCIDAIVIACIGKNEYDRMAEFYQAEEKYEKPVFKKPWDTFTKDLKDLYDELLVVHQTTDNMPKHSRKRINGTVRDMGDSARSSLHKDTYYGAIKQGDEIKYVIRRPITSFTNISELDCIVDETVKQTIKASIAGKVFKEAIAQPIYMNKAKGVLIKKVRCFANSVKKPLNIRKQRDVSTNSHKQEYHVTNDNNYAIAIYEGIEKGKIKRAYKIINMLEAAEYFKSSNGNQLHPLVPKQSKEGYPIKYCLTIGMHVILYEQLQELNKLSPTQLANRLYSIIGISNTSTTQNGVTYVYGYVSLKFARDARASKDIKPQKGLYKKDEPFRAMPLLNHNQFEALVEGKDFVLTPLGEIIFKNI
ncbi:MAG: CRISPR-associated protein Csn1 [Paludibacteraceae bacterium]|nr:CRISPR-associated protein Csn1 [Paludibacteraceae bacterium]